MSSSRTIGSRTQRCFIRLILLASVCGPGAAWTQLAVAQQRGWPEPEQATGGLEASERDLQLSLSPNAVAGVSQQHGYHADAVAGRFDETPSLSLAAQDLSGDTPSSTTSARDAQSGEAGSSASDGGPDWGLRFGITFLFPR